MKDSYSFKDILFGLRNEYLLLYQQLDTLNRYINLENNDLEDVHFYLDTCYSDLDKVKMRCILYDRKNKIEKKLEKIMIQMGIYPNYRMSDIIEINDKYDIEKYPEIINKSKKQEFNQSVYYILNTEFVKNSRFIHYGTGYDDMPFLSLNTSSIYWMLNNYASLEFNPYNGDYIHIHSFKGILTREKIENIFDSRFSKDRFSIYYQGMIESSLCFDKSFEMIGNLGYSRTINFDIVEDNKGLVLRKI